MWKVERIKEGYCQGGNLIMVIVDAEQELTIVPRPLLLLSAFTAEHVRLKVQKMKVKLHLRKDEYMQSLLKM